MFSNMVDLAETDFVRNASYPRNTQGFEKNISFATTSCLPEIGVSRFNHLLVIKGGQGGCIIRNKRKK
jgi:hypothetical protein